MLITLGVFGTGLLYGDGVITPAISVLSAVEGFEVATDAFKDWVVPVTIAILVALFAVQKRGTASIAKVFGPMMVAWFGVIGALGLAQIAGGCGQLDKTASWPVSKWSSRRASFVPPLPRTRRATRESKQLRVLREAAG